jgi:hypothetical protein
MARFFILSGILLFLCGCATLDALTGINPDGSVKPGGGAVGSGANLLGSFIPWAGAALGAVGTLYSQVRRKKYADALKSTISGISAVRQLRSETGEIKLTDARLVEILREIQGKNKTDKLIKRVIEKNGSKK